MQSLSQTMAMLFQAQADAPSDLNDLYNLWGQLQENYDKSNVGSQDVNGYLNTGATPGSGTGNGANTPLENTYDPACSTYYQNCAASSQQPFDVWASSAVTDPDPTDPTTPEDPAPAANKSSPTTLIIAVVVSVGVVVIFFIIFTCCLVSARKNKKWCWEDKDKKSRQDPNSSIEISLASNASSTHGRSSVTTPAPSTSTSTSAPSATSSRIPVEDPSLPPDWKAFQGTNEHEVFYVNSLTMKSTWVHPVTGVNSKAEGTW
jgi:hypothetical protein